MNIAVIGTGYVGTTTSVALAMNGHTVFGIDQDSERVKSLNQSKLPIYEEGIEADLGLTVCFKIIRESNGQIFFRTIERFDTIVDIILSKEL